MVTHDVGLKYFSNRIIWLRDGKIQRVEHVSDAKRSEVHAQLAEDMRGLGLATEEEEEEALEGTAPVAGLKHTSVRQPQDYRTHREFNAGT